MSDTVSRTTLGIVLSFSISITGLSIAMSINALTKAVAAQGVCKPTRTG